VDALKTVSIVTQLGFRAYEPVWREMQRFTDQRDAHTPDQLWLVEHPPIYTQGQAGKPEHVLFRNDIELLAVDRGGQVTYHGPGQLVAYPLIDLKRSKLGVRELVTRLEQVVIDQLNDYAIHAARRPGAPGVYVGDAKIASLGLRVRRGCSFHGVALNIAMDLSPFDAINPCGLRGTRVTQVLEFFASIKLERAQADFVQHFSRHFDQFQGIPLSASRPGQ